MTPEKKINRCAVYTRKSTEEGLDQSFNSLHAQREACEAFIASQRHEGWTPIKVHYDDGGFSGGNMERPALRRLLEDIDSGKVDSVVVYKVDRLTRSLADFAKIIERFDGHSVSFVSVTQQFNTTTSMGRLTLNVLLSFAQFEREVTGERIRDKIAASKRKGMWMGGSVPLGYDVRDRRLHVNEQEAEIVRRIFRCYLQRGCVSKLQQELRTAGVRSKTRVSAKGCKTGGGVYSRGALYKILQNRLYIGEIAHRGLSHKGEHESLISRRLWDRVQKQLQVNGQARRNGTRGNHSSLLVGLLFTGDGVRMTPTHSLKNGKRFRYYAARTPEGLSHRVSIAAPLIEGAVIEAVSGFLSNRSGPFKNAISGLPLALRRKACDSGATIAKQLAERQRVHPATIRGFVSRVTVDGNELEIEIDTSKLRACLLGAIYKPGLHVPSVASVRVGASFDRHAKPRLSDESGAIASARGPGLSALTRAICRAHLWSGRLIRGEIRDSKAIAVQMNLNERYVNRTLTMGFLSPVLIEQILKGTQQSNLSLHFLNKVGTPRLWSEQEQLFQTKHDAKLR